MARRVRLAALLPLAALLLLAGGVAAQEKYTGRATTYTWPGEKNSQFAGGFNACQFGRLSPYFETYFAALPTPMWDDSYCGRCVAVRGTGERATGRVVVAMIVDECATCAWGDLDFTSRAANDITGYAFDSQPIEWEWTSCANPVPPRVAFHDLAGGQILVSKARERGYNVNMDMVFADLTLTGGAVPFPRGPIATANLASDVAKARNGAAIAAAGVARQRQQEAQVAAAEANQKAAAANAAAASNSTLPEVKAQFAQAAQAALAKATAATQAAQAAVTAAQAANRLAQQAAADAQAKQAAAAQWAAAERVKQRQAQAAAAQANAAAAAAAEAAAAEQRRLAIAAMQQAATTTANTEAAANAMARATALLPPSPPQWSVAPPPPPPSPPLTQERLEELFRLQAELDAAAELSALENTPEGAPPPPTPDLLPELASYLDSLSLNETLALNATLTALNITLSSGLDFGNSTADGNVTEALAPSPAKED